MPEVVSDSFNRANNPSSLGVSDSGHLWVARKQSPYIAAGPPLVYAPAGLSTMGILSGHAYSTDPTRGQVFTIDHGTPDVRTVLTLSLGFDPGTGMGMAVRWQGDAQFYEVFCYHRITSPQDYFVLVRRIDGPTTGVDLVGGIGPEPAIFLAPNGTSGDHEFGINVIGPRFSFYWDGESKGETEDNAYPAATNHGLLQYFSSAPLINAFNGQASAAGIQLGALAI